MSYFCTGFFFVSFQTPEELCEGLCWPRQKGTNCIVVSYKRARHVTLAHAWSQKPRVLSNTQHRTHVFVTACITRTTARVQQGSVLVCILKKNCWCWGRGFWDLSRWYMTWVCRSRPPPAHQQPLVAAATTVTTATRRQRNKTVNNLPPTDTT